MNSKYECQCWLNFCCFKTICMIINHDTAYHKIKICAHLKFRSACTSVQSELGFCCSLYRCHSLFIGLVKNNNQTAWLRITVLFRRTHTECCAKVHVCMFTCMYKIYRKNKTEKKDKKVNRKKRNKK